MVNGEAAMGIMYSGRAHILKQSLPDLQISWVGSTNDLGAMGILKGRAYDPERLVQPEDVAAMVVAAVSLPRTAEVTDISIRPTRNPAASGDLSSRS